MNKQANTFEATQAAYMEAFIHHYPNHKVAFEPARTRRGDPKACYLVIDGDRGGMTLTEDTMQEAIAAFNR